MNVASRRGDDIAVGAVVPSSGLQEEVEGATGGRLLRTYGLLVFLWLYLPLVVMAMFGFNDTKSTLNATWQGFTLRWYRDVFQIQQLTRALENSLFIATVSTVVAGCFGTLIGLALGRYRFRGASSVETVLFACIAAPEVVLGAALLSLFLTLGVDRGIATIVIAHVMLTTSFVAVTVRSRAALMDPNLEEAARDLGAGSLATFRHVTLPLILPGVLAGCALAFVLSIDNFITSSFVAGPTLTFPLWIYGATRVGVPPQVNVMGTMLLLFGVGAVVLAATSGRRRAR